MSTFNHPIVTPYSQVNRQDTPSIKVEPSWPVEYYLNENWGIRAGGGNVPDYRRKIASGDDASTILTAERRENRVVPCDHYLRSEHYLGNTVLWDRLYADKVGLGSVSLNTDYDGAVATSVDNRAKSLFVKKCLETQSRFNGTVFLGELRETLNMIRNPAKSLRKGVDEYLSAVKRRRRGTKAQKRKILADSWLEYSFGWAPLINDVKDGAEALSRIAHRQSPFEMVTAVSASAKDLGVDTTRITSFSAFFVNRTTRKRFEAVRIYRGVVNLHMSGHLMTQQNLGFRWDSFIPTLWELVPYSFLVDYFTNIGDVLQSWSFATSNLRWARTTYVYTAVAERQQTTMYGLGYDPVYPKKTILIDSPGSSRAMHKQVGARLHVESLVPTLALEMPGMASTKWLNLAALATSQRRLTPY